MTVRVVNTIDCRLIKHPVIDRNNTCLILGRAYLHPHQPSCGNLPCPCARSITQIRNFTDRARARSITLVLYLAVRVHTVINAFAGLDRAHAHGQYHKFATY